MCVSSLLFGMITNVSFSNYCLDVHISVSSIFIQSSNDGTSSKAERVEKDEVQAPPSTKSGIKRGEVSENPQSQASTTQVSSLKLIKKSLCVVDILLFITVM